MAVLLLVSQTLTCAATGEDLSVSSVQAKAGEYVYLTVTLNKAVTADSIGLSYQYDAAHLKVDPDLCQWGKSGILSDFDRDNNNGVWAGVSSENLQGKICVLAFKVLDKATFSRTEVSVTVMLKNGSENLGTYTATGAVTLPCTHTYGPWQSVGALGHSHSCEKCKETHTEDHKWDAGTLSELPDKPGFDKLTYTCQVCKYTREEEVASGSVEENLPNQNPEQNNQTQQQQQQQQQQKPQQPVTPGSQQQQTQIPVGGDVDIDPNHNHEEPTKADPNTEQTINPDYVTIGGDEHAGHNHGSEPENGNPWVNFEIIAGVLAVLIVAAILFIKKKR